MDTERKLLTYLIDKQIYVYGAGKIAGDLVKRLDRSQIAIQGYLVTDKDANPEEINGVKVYQVEELVKEGIPLENLTIVIAVAKGQLDILDELMKMGYHNIIILNKNVQRELKVSEIMDVCNEAQEDYLYTTNYPDIAKEHCVVMDKKDRGIVFRTWVDYVMQDTEKTIERCRREEFEKLYGTYQRLPFVEKPGISNALAEREQIEIYAATSHYDKQSGHELYAEGVIPLQVGAALTYERRGCLTDDTGDNLSIENRNYCECTGLYWVWKNTRGQKYVGLCHYRRRFRWDESSVEYMLKQDLDAVVTIPIFEPNSMKDFFYKFIGKMDWELLRRAVTDYDAAYGEIFRRHEQGNFVIPCNLAIFKREWFDRYCEFAFTVATQIDREYKSRNVMRQDRYMGYLFENMLSLFLIRHKEEMKFAYADMEFIQ